MAIEILESSIIDQIAAGEVVERPAHMIKELVENAIDAKATEVTVTFEKGGRNVTVKDNGLGIERDQLKLAVARHATSKIQKIDDLWQIATYGFRGEALASIAAVCHLKLSSRRAGQDVGAGLEVQFGRVGDIVSVGCDLGTTIEVRDLFQNIPARLKFLKTDAAEGSQVKNLLKALALANPNVTLRVFHENELVYFWPAQEQLLARTRDVLGEPELYEGEAQLDQMRARAIVASPNRTMGHPRQIWLFVQGRYVQDRGLQAAVIEGFRNFLMHGEYPVAAIYLECDPEDLDVNVSPTKSQVKFRDSSSAFRVVQRAVRDVMDRAPWVGSIVGAVSATPAVEGPSLNVESPTLTFESPARRVPNFADQILAQPSMAAEPRAVPTAPVRPPMASPPPREWGAPKAQPQWSTLEVLGQANLTYIVTQSREAVVYIDQHAAHERIMFEKLMASIRAGQVEVQNFLIPPVVEVSEEGAAALMEARNELAEGGLYIDLLGPTQVAVNGAPALAKPEALPALIEKLASDYVSQGGSHSLQNRLADRVATLACHSAIRAGQSLSLEEMKALLVQMDEFPQSSFCPHGRPVYVSQAFRALERDFGRIV